MRNHLEDLPQHPLEHDISQKDLLTVESTRENMELDAVLEEDQEITLKVPVVRKVTAAEDMAIALNGPHKHEGLASILEEDEEITLKAPVVRKVTAPREAVIAHRRFLKQRENTILLLKKRLKKINLIRTFDSGRKGASVREIVDFSGVVDIGKGTAPPELVDHAEIVEQAWVPGTFGYGSTVSLDDISEADALRFDDHTELLKQAWVPGTFGYGSTVSQNNDDDEGPEFYKRVTLPMIVLEEISSQQGQSTPSMQSEISGAASSAAIVGMGSILGNVLKYGNSLIIQRGFGAGPFGLYTLAMSTVTLVVSVFNLGLDDAMVRFVSVYKDKKHTNLLISLTIFCSIMAGVAGVIGALVVLFFAPFLAQIRREPEIAPLLLLLSPLVPLSCMQAIWTGGLQGYKAFKWRVLVQRIIVPGALTFLLVLVLIYYRDLKGVVLATLLSACVGAAFYLYFFSRFVSQSSRRGPKEYRIQEWLGFALPNFLTSILDTVLESIDTILLAFLVASIVAVGQYAAAIKISSFISVPLLTFNVMFAPTISELFSRGEKQKLTVMFKVVTSWIITFSLPIFLIAVLFARPLLGISGPSFVDAWPLLIALAVGNMVNAGTGSVGYMLLMTGHQKLSFLNSLTAVVLNVMLGIILTSRYGAMGTAIATGIALAVVNLMRLLQVELLLKMHPYRRATLKPLAAGVISSFLVAALLNLMSLTPMSIQIFHLHFSLQLALIFVFLACYIVLLALFDVNPEDKIVLDTLAKKLKRGKSKKKKGV